MVAPMVFTWTFCTWIVSAAAPATSRKSETSSNAMDDILLIVITLPENRLLSGNLPVRRSFSFILLNNSKIASVRRMIRAVM
jgi:hypothetical protein